jgi:hypothetical protein
MECQELLMRLRNLFPLFAAIALSACGGSSGGTAGPTVPPPAAGTPLVISAANSKPAVRTAYGATSDSMGAGAAVGGSPISMSPGNGLNKPFVNRATSTALTRFMQKDPFGPLVSDCFGGGTETTAGNMAVLGALTAGDTINVDYLDCVSEFGETLNGRMEMTIVIFSGDLIFGPFLLDASVLLIDFEVATAEDTILSNGDARVSLDTTGMPVVLMSISGSSLTAASLQSTETITNYSTSQTVDVTPPESYTLNSSGTVDSSQLSGSISYSTPVTFQGQGAGYPFAGEMLITGSGNATIRLIALDAINVRIETDSNGDGVVDATEDTTWDDIAL